MEVTVAEPVNQFFSQSPEEVLDRAKAAGTALGIGTGDKEGSTTKFILHGFVLSSRRRLLIEANIESEGGGTRVSVTGRSLSTGAPPEPDYVERIARVFMRRMVDPHSKRSRWANIAWVWSSMFAVVFSVWLCFFTWRNVVLGGLILVWWLLVVAPIWDVLRRHTSGIGSKDEWWTVAGLSAGAVVCTALLVILA